jgi:ATP-dependent DNA helicase RecG
MKILNIKSLQKIIGSSESTTIEWKPSLSQMNDIIESVTAFANTEGGRLLIGVSSDGKIVGVTIGKDTIENLANKIAQHTEPKIQPRITVRKINGKEIIVIEVVPSKDKLVLADGRAYKRVGPSTRQMGKEEYERLILDKHRELFPFDEEVCKGASLSDIDAAKVRHFLSVARAERGLDISQKGSLKEILMRLKLLKGGKPTNGAILLFAKDPAWFFEQSEVKCIRFKGTDVTGEMIDLKPVNGDSISLVKDVEKFIYDHIPMRAWIESGKLERQEKWLYPPKAIREALVNALAHRDYQTTSKVQIRIFDDRIEFWNPGRLPEGWTAETLKKKHESKPGNRSIAKAFFWIRYAEEVGTGTNKIIQLCQEWGLPEPEFEYAGSSLVVTFRKDILTEEQLDQLGLNERQMKAVQHIKAKGSVNNREYRELFDISDEWARRDLAELVKKKVFKPEGKGRSRRYLPVLGFK